MPVDEHLIDLRDTGQQALLQWEPNARVVSAWNPLPDLNEFALDLPGGGKIAANGRIGLACVTVDLSAKTVTVDHAFHGDQAKQPGAANAQERTSVDLHRLARELTAELVPRALQSGVDLGFDDANDATPPAVHVQGNALLLREALVNLIDNAVRYAGRGSEVTVRVRPAGREALLIVEDNGPGIAPADRERVFERFVRGAQDDSGCGLGLAIVREVAQRHGGRAWIEGVEPRGARVCIELPLPRD